MARWTVEQEEILYQYGHKGPEYCANLIRKRFGVYRSAESTKRHANRIGASMMRYETCPHCGAIVYRLNRNSGLCETCNMRSLTEEIKAIRMKIEEGVNPNEYQKAKRRYNSERQAMVRARNRAYGDSAKLSPKMSPPRSGRQKNFADPPEKEMCAPA